ncbi:MAG TPA: hypothetical protein VJY41_07435 [Prolixibacteraceae bacterium]|nr:hypothetical protein [Prolixibacteraceae bacterium]
MLKINPKLLFCFFLFLVISFGCCEAQLEKQFFLTADQKSIIPYQTNETLNFITNTGYAFTLKVDSVFTFMARESLGEESCLYYEYETIEACLSSVHPELKITISSTALHDFNEISLYNFNLSVNNKYFRINNNNDYDSFIQHSFRDTTILNHSYSDVWIFELGFDFTLNDDSLAFWFDKIIYSKEHGIELITFTNNDYYELEDNK